LSSWDHFKQNLIFLNDNEKYKDIYSSTLEKIKIMKFEKENCVKKTFTKNIFTKQNLLPNKNIDCGITFILVIEK